MKTWGGLPVSDDKPHGAAVIVWRHGGADREFLILHRRHQGPDFEGDWAWTPPSGGRLPGEALEDTARRELLEEAGLDLLPEPSDLGSDDWAVFVAEASADALVILNDEHDRFAWLPAEQAAAKCRPPLVGRTLLAVDEWLGQTAAKPDHGCYT